MLGEKGILAYLDDLLIDLKKGQMNDGPLSLVRSWFNKVTGKVNDKS